MSSKCSEKVFCIELNDIFDELMSENNRLLNELLFANQCLNVLNKFKIYLNRICAKFESIIGSEDKQSLNELTEEYNNCVINETKTNVKTIETNECLKSCVKSSSKTRIKSEKGINEELNDKSVSKSDSKTTGNANTRQSSERIQCFDSTTQSFKCPDIECINKSYETYRKLRKHINYFHRTPTHVCDYPNCGKVFKERHQLRTHLNVHKDLKPFVCENCGHRCRTKGALKTHETTHLSDKPFKCSYDGCDKAFKSKYSLNWHLLEHKNDPKVRQFHCSYSGCEQRFRSSAALRCHLSVHTHEPSFKCGISSCGEMFISRSLLRKHKESAHNKTFRRTLYSCDWPGCDYRNSLASVKVHKTLHTGEKAFVCDWPECGKAFRLKSMLRDHKNIHNNVKPYACHWPGCHYRCCNSANITKHLKQVHKNKT